MVFSFLKRTWSNGMTVAFQAISAGPTPAVRTNKNHLATVSKQSNNFCIMSDIVASSIMSAIGFSCA